MKLSGKKIAVWSGAVLAVIAVSVLWGVCDRLQVPRALLAPVFYNDVKEMQLVSAMQTHLNTSVEAEKSAVLADTDEASHTSAVQAQQASDAVEADRRKLGTLINAGSSDAEQKAFRQFSLCWEKFQQIDRELLPLSEQNTNIKAYDLSHGAADVAMNHLEVVLKQITENLQTPSGINVCEIRELASRIMIAALKIQVLQSPHIAESDETRMNAIETQIHTCDQKVHDALSRLSGLIGADAVKSVETAYADFWRINTEILKLSRQNSNIRSMVMSLGQKRKATAECQDTLTALETLLQNRSFKATR